jgi:uncharacterized protein (UPF0332 family)
MSSLPNADFNPVEFYQFASQLYHKDTQEVVYRTIVGRAYYAAFLCGKNYAAIKNSSGSVHNDVIAHFQKHNRLVHKNLRDLKDLRSKADYSLAESVQKREAGESLRLAKNILTTLNYLP